jgi:hypothetical protein
MIMAVIRKTPGKVATKPVKKEEVVEEIDETTVDTDVDVEEEEVVKPAPKKATAKAPAKKAEPKKATAKAPAKKAEPKKATAKSESKLDLSTTKKVRGIEDVELGKCGSLKRDDFYIIVKDRCEKEHGINLGSKENVARIFSVMEETIISALTDANTFHFGGRNFNRKAVNARVYNPPIGKSYLVMPHYDMKYTLKNAENIVGEMDGDNFVADDGTVYTPDDLVAMSE